MNQMKYMRNALIAQMFLLIASATYAADYVITISIDGMGSVYVEPMMADGLLPNLQLLHDEGASTLNARTDDNYAVTLPNHVCMVTGRSVTGPRGHHWAGNSDPDPGATHATNRGQYIASMFDVAHDDGRRTAMWSGKSKFSLFDVSFNAEHGQSDSTGKDNGKDKIDYAIVDTEALAAALTTNFIAAMTREPAHLAFVHYRDPDTIGHGHGWGTTPYRDTLIAVDQSLGMILAMVEQDPELAGRTAIIVTSDHGGHGNGHGDMDDLRDYMIPFIVWGAGVEQGDLYEMNRQSRKNPRNANILYAAQEQPIRNGDMGNLALDLLGLGPIPGSTINQNQDLKVDTPVADDH